ncbi:MAG: uroporphyrinogen decarboxylase family protein [Planctomycetota bacterium]
MPQETMTSRERLLRALRHEEPDRVPIDLGGNQTGIHRFAYQALLDHLGFEEKIEIMDAVQQLARPSEAVLERLRVDTRYIAAGAASDWKGGIELNERGGRLWHDLTDEFGVTWSMPDDMPYFMDISHHPLALAEIGEIDDYPFPQGDDPGRFFGLRDRALEIRNHTPYAVVSGISGVVYEICWYLRGLEQWLCDTVLQPELCEKILDQTLRFWLDWFRLFLDEVGDVVDVIMIGDDLAGQTGPLFNPAFYRRVIQPRHARLVQYIRSRTRARVWYHTCGGCAAFIPDLLDNGIQVLNPVQISATGMDPAALKRQYGKQLAFWGGAIDSQHVLPSASPEKVRDDVRRHLEIWKPGGGYVFNNVHNIQAGVPPENVVAMYDAAFEHGFYD